MRELEPNIKIQLINGDEAEVIDELGRGGQGIVYKCRYNGNLYALKWYHKVNKNQDVFYENLKRNIEQGEPNESFLWPLFLTKKRNNHYGYLMNLRPDGYYDLSEFLLAKQKFESVDVMLISALKIIKAFRKLILKGLSYQDLNDGNFFINPKTGDVLICDNDNVIESGKNLGISGKMRYMAPEVVLGGKPNKESDLFSMSVILFLLFFKNHPFEGKKVLSSPGLTEKLERKYFGSEILFIGLPS